MAKPTLMLVHGLIGSLEYFEPSRHVRNAGVRTCDLLGYGRYRDAPLEQLTLSGQVEHVSRFIRDSSDTSVWLLGHSMGGAIAMLLADRRPELVAGLINVEGNFTLKDAFWSSRIMTKKPEDWEEEYRRMARDVAGWLDKCGVTPTPHCAKWARHILDWQPAGTLYAMSRSLVEETRDPGYLEAVRGVVDRGVPIHLIAGERSAAAWDLPEFIRRAARSYVELPDTGHIMMLEDPDGFCRIVDTCLTGRQV